MRPSLASTVAVLVWLAASPLSAAAEPAAAWTGAELTTLARRIASLGLEPGSLTDRPVGAARLFELGVEADGLPVRHRGIAWLVDADGQVRQRRETLPAVPWTAAHPRPAAGLVRDGAARHGLAIEHVGSFMWLEGRQALVPVVEVEARWREGGERMRLWLEAAGFLPLDGEPLLDTGRPLANVYEKNPVVTPGLGLVTLTDLAGDATRLVGDYARVLRCDDRVDCATASPATRADPAGRFLFAPRLEDDAFDDPFAEVNVYWHLTRANRWFRSSFGWDAVVGAAEAPAAMEARVGMAWYNAAFVPGNDERAAYLVFGQDEVDFAYDAGVVTHELGHAVSRSLWSHTWLAKDEWGSDLQPFGLEEGQADIWAALLGDDPVMNSYIRGTRSAATGATCPEAVMAEGHMEAYVIGGFGWDLRERLGGEVVAQLLYRALPLLTAEAGFDEFVEVLAASATALAEVGGTVPLEAAAAVREVGAARGLDLPECGRRLVPLPVGERRRVYGYGRERTGGRDYPFGLQWRFTVPAGRVAASFDFTWRYPAEVEPGYTVHLSRGRPVAVTWTDPEALAADETLPAFVAAADAVFPGAPGHLGWPALGEEPLAPGDEIYVLVTAATPTPILVLDVVAHGLASQPPPLPGDAGLPDAAEVTARSGDGCSLRPALAGRRAPWSRLLESFLVGVGVL